MQMTCTCKYGRIALTFYDEDEGSGEQRMEHYKQIIINMTVEDDTNEADLEILKQHIEKCIEMYADPKKIYDVKVRVN